MATRGGIKDRLKIDSFHNSPKSSRTTSFSSLHQVSSAVSDTDLASLGTQHSSTTNNQLDQGSSMSNAVSQSITTTLGRFHDVDTRGQPAMYKISWDHVKTRVNPGEDTIEFPIPANSRNAQIIYKALLDALKRDRYNVVTLNGNESFAIINGHIYGIESSLHHGSVARYELPWIDDQNKKFISVVPVSVVPTKLAKDFHPGQLENLAFNNATPRDGPLDTTLNPDLALTLRLNSDHPSLQVRPMRNIIVKDAVRLDDFVKRVLDDTDFGGIANRSDWIRSLSPFFRGLQVRRTYLLNSSRNDKTRISSIIAFGLPANEQTFLHKDRDTKIEEVMTVAKYFGKPQDLPHRLDQPELVTVNIGREKEPIWIPMEKLEVIQGQTLPKKLVEFIGSLNKDAQMQWNEWTETQDVPDTAPTTASISQVNTYLDAQVYLKPIDLVSKKLAAPEYVDHSQIDAEKGLWQLDAKILKHVGDYKTSPAVLWVGQRVVVPERKLHEALRKLFDAFDTKYGLENIKYKPADPNNTQLPPQAKVETILADFQTGYPFASINTPALILTYQLEEGEHAKLRRNLDAAGMRAVIFELHHGGPGKGKANFINFSENFEIHFPIRELALKINALTDTGRNFTFTGTAGHDTMVVGATLIKPGSEANKDCPPIASVVASSDKFWNHFPGGMRTQTSSAKHEIEGMKSMIGKALVTWKKNSGSLPKNLLMYRAGTSELEYRKVVDDEVNAIRRAYALLASCPENQVRSKLKITIILVEKNHKARFAPTSGEADRLDHGSIIDIPQLDDGCRQFFLQSFSNLNVGLPEGEKKQTAKPARNTHYFIVKDEARLGDGKNKDLTYSLCWMAPHSSSVLTYAAPIALAGKLAKRGRTYLHEVWTGKGKVSDIPTRLWKVQTGRSVPWHPSLDNVMFYL